MSKFIESPIISRDSVKVGDRILVELQIAEICSDPNDRQPIWATTPGSGMWLDIGDIKAKQEHPLARGDKVTIPNMLGVWEILHVEDGVVMLRDMADDPAYITRPLASCERAPL